ncbi:MAG: hypothetical protein LBV50_04575 [Novosphingobium sp.]|jgi:hypothetical protein|nr:hypothetical protein [Novosphingobium sp.]
MIARRSVLGLLAGGAAAGLGGCGLLGYSYRFRMTVEAKTPQGLRTGSSVYEVSARRLVALTAEEAERSVAVRGEALVVDLPDGPIFVLLKAPDGNPHGSLDRLSMAALDKDYRNDWVESARRIAASWRPLRAELLHWDWPLMVRFADIADPASVERVAPETAGIFSIMLETTRDPVTTGIEKRLPWFYKYKGKFFDGSSTISEDLVTEILAAHLTSRSFSTEAFK